MLEKFDEGRTTVTEEGSSFEDFFATELLRELKEENARKERTIRDLNKTLFRVVVAAVIAILLIVGGFLWYLYQYDFFGYDSSTTTNTADGVYAVVDSDGNCISSDLTADEIIALMEEIEDGESDPNSNSN